MPNVNCKLSGLLTEVVAGPGGPGDVRPYLEHALEVFGPHRCLYGSDWPVLTLAGSYADWCQTVLEVVEELPGGLTGHDAGAASRQRPQALSPKERRSDMSIDAAADSIWADLARARSPPGGPRRNWASSSTGAPYSVPAWAEPSGALGAVPEDEWFAHNAYAEWYGNTIRIPGSPAAEHHREVYGDAPYDDFLDAWTAERLRPGAWAALFAGPAPSTSSPPASTTTAIALWDAPGTGTRNTVHRGPRRDLVAEIADAVRAAGMRFGVYYSGGLDWNVSDFPPHTTMAEVAACGRRTPPTTLRAAHVRDLVARYEPSVLWNDIEWPDAGKRTGAWSLHGSSRDSTPATPRAWSTTAGATPTGTSGPASTSGHRTPSRGPSGRTAAGIGCRSATTRSRRESVLTGHQLARHCSPTSSPAAAGCCSTSGRPPRGDPARPSRIRSRGTRPLDVSAWATVLRVCSPAWPDGPPGSSERALDPLAGALLTHAGAPWATAGARPELAVRGDRGVRPGAAANLIGSWVLRAEDDELTATVDQLGRRPGRDPATPSLIPQESKGSKDPWSTTRTSAARR